MTGLDREMEINDKLYPILKSKIKNDKLNGKTVTAKKETVCITTRDGICLSTNIWFPDPLIWGNGPYNVYFAELCTYIISILIHGYSISPFFVCI